LQSLVRFIAALQPGEMSLASAGRSIVYDGFFHQHIGCTMLLYFSAAVGPLLLLHRLLGWCLLSWFLGSAKTLFLEMVIVDGAQ